jgi:hypothetical protein
MHIIITYSLTPWSSLSSEADSSLAGQEIPHLL